MHSERTSIKVRSVLWLLVLAGFFLPPGTAMSQDPTPPAGVSDKSRTVVLDDLLFGFNEDSLKPEHAEILEWLALYLVKNPDKKVIISGHTDASGPDAYNTYLSKKRAYAVSQALTNAGIERERILLRWFGEKQPLGDNANVSNRVKSRRVEIEIQ